MDSTQRITISSAENKKANALDRALNVRLSGIGRILPESKISSVLDAYDEYISERSKSNKFRLVFNIKPICSNLLFNPITEIVKDEGTDKVFCLNYKSVTTSELEDDGLLPKKSVYVKTGTTFLWSADEAIRDTQLSSSKNGFVYHCGLNIFNNHIFRTAQYKKVNFNDEQMDSMNSYVFNTLGDKLKDVEGKIVSHIFPVIKLKLADRNETIVEGVPKVTFLYQRYDDIGFKASVQQNLKEENGWYGFSNPSKLPSYQASSNGTDFEYAPINKVINSEAACNFIDMYPTREYYSFNPIYNKFYDRLEKNWDYCLTYPSSSTTSVDFINELTDENGTVSHALSVLMFDEKTYDDNGLNVLTVYSVSCHGLREGDYVNIYNENELVYANAQVMHVVDKYIFQVPKTEPDISDAWIDIEDNVYTYHKDGTGTTLVMDSNGKPYLYISGSSATAYPIVTATNRCNVDDKAQNLSFKKVVGNIECKYYVRIFSRLPNFKFADESISDYSLYKNGSKLIDRYSDKKYEFESHIGQNAFAKTAYSDPATEIVFTDDVDLSCLRDNLGRPVSEIYLTIIKRNKGYKEWYGINDRSANLARNIRLKNKDIEFSHCFGKVNCAFLLNDYGIYGREHVDVRNLVAAQSKAADASVGNTGLLNLNNSKLGDEISYDTDKSFYGDLCCYSPNECHEESLQSVMFRFNTAQRELTENDAALRLLGTMKSNGEGLMTTDYILSDNYDSKITYLYHIEQEYYYAFPRAEGYYYKPHYKLQAKRISSVMSESKPFVYQLSEMVDYGEKMTMYGRKRILLVKTETPHGLTPSDKLILYIKSLNEFYRLSIYSVETDDKFLCSLQKEDNTDVTDMTYLIAPENIGDFSLVKKADDTPSYAELSKDGSCVFRWRNIVSNGTEDDETIIYPFTNGAFYITKEINLYLRRQKPHTNSLSFAASDYENIVYEPEGEQNGNGNGYDETDTEKAIDTCNILNSPLLQLNL